MAKSYLKMKPQSDYYVGGYPPVLWTGSLTDTASYSASGSTSDYIYAYLLPKPDYIAWNGGALLYSVTISFNYEMSCSGGTYFTIRPAPDWTVVPPGSGFTDVRTINGAGSLSGAYSHKFTLGIDGYSLYPFGWDHIFGYPTGTAKYIGISASQNATGCSATISDYLFVVEFTPDDPFILTKNPTNISMTTVTGKGEIVTLPEGYFLERGFEYYKEGDDENIIEVIETWEGEFGEGFEAGEYELPITGLEKETTYYYRAIAENGTLRIEGEWVEFITEPEPIIQTISAERSSVYARTILKGELL